MPEVELKFAVTARDRERIARSRALAHARPSRRRLTTLYLDTPDEILRKRGMALRLRRSGARWIQSLKGARSGRGGLHSRDEWEFDRPDASIDLALFAATPLARVPGADRLHERLEVAFRVDMVRTAWVVAPREGARLEVALDVGAAIRGDRTAPVSELEIECLEGPVDAAFDFAELLLEEVALRASATSKAERGWRLARGEVAGPVHARRVALRGAMGLARAGREVVGAALEQLQANEEGVLAAEDPEFVHQARVALRRIRSALRLFRRAIGRRRSRAWRASLARLSAALGVARDGDVFALESLPPVLAQHGDARLAERLANGTRRRAARERTRAARALERPGYTRTVLAISRWLAGADGERTPRDRERHRHEESLEAFAARVIARRHHAFLEHARHPEHLDARERHRLRIEAKRLRYGVDALASLFPSPRTERYRDALSGLQDALGEANDASNAARLVSRIGAPPEFVRFAQKRFAAAARGDGDRIRRLVRRLRQAGAPGSAPP